MKSLQNKRLDTQTMQEDEIRLVQIADTYEKGFIDFLSIIEDSCPLGKHTIFRFKLDSKNQSHCSISHQPSWEEIVEYIDSGFIESYMDSTVSALFIDQLHKLKEKYENSRGRIGEGELFTLVAHLIYYPEDSYAYESIVLFDGSDYRYFIKAV